MPDITIERAFHVAVQHHRAGRLNEAEDLYRRILGQQPRHAGALHHLGLIAHQIGRNDAAVELIREAIALQPGNAAAHRNLGNILKNAGQLDGAIAACRQAIALEPDWAEAYSNLASLLVDAGRLDDAICAYHQATTLKPDFPEALNNMGNALRDMGRPEEAVAAYRRAIALKPNYPGAHFNIGNTLKDKGLLDEAIIAFRQAIDLSPAFAEAYSDLGVALREAGRLDEAVVACRHAITCNANYYQAYNSLGNALTEKGELDDAANAYHQALSLNPESPETYSNLGIALMSKGQLDEAIAAYRQAIAFQPVLPRTHSNLIAAFHYHPGYDASAIAQEHRRWNHQHAEPLKKFIQPHLNDRNPDRRLRIGYVSPDFRDHPVARFLTPLLIHHDKGQVEVFAYAQVAAPDAMTQRLRSCTDGWRSIVGLSDALVADRIRQDRIDILVDLAMHTADNRLLVFARKPSPVQVTYLAYCHGTGLETIDYRVSDPYLDPPGEDESIYSEQTIRLPETYWCYEPSVTTPEVGALPVLEKGFITFGCLNHFCKVSEPTLAGWARILQAVPNSHLFIHAHEGTHRKRVRRRLEAEGIEPRRVQFTGYMPMAKYFELYRRIDIALDTFPYGGGTTTCDAMWMGVPVISLVGKTAVGRGGLSILSNIGLPELVARSEAEYARIAIALAGDLHRLGHLRSTLRQRMQRSPLMDAPRFARNIESAYRHMWRTWCERADVAS